MRAQQIRSHPSVKGMVTQLSSRTARSGQFAHEFICGAARYSLFSEEEVVPLQDGDVIQINFQKYRLKTGSRREYLRVISETIEILTPTSPEGSEPGFVYVLSNPAMPGLVKVGYTTGDPERRAAELSSTTGVPSKFVVEWFLPIVGDPRAVEHRAHAKLASCRAGKEFFRVDLGAARTGALTGPH